MPAAASSGSPAPQAAPTAAVTQTDAAVVKPCTESRRTKIAGRSGEAAESAQEALTIATRIRHVEWTAAALRGLGIAWETAGLPDRGARVPAVTARRRRGTPLRRLGPAPARTSQLLSTAT